MTPGGFFKRRPSLSFRSLQRAFMEILSVQAKQIEGIVKYWRSLFPKLEGLEELKGGNPFLIECHDFAINHRIFNLQFGDRFEHLRETLLRSPFHFGKAGGPPRRL